MKKVIMKEDKAVSPIIATILLVAITVVLAATLYTILGGYTNFLGASTPLGTITATNTTGTYNVSYTIFVNQYNGQLSLNYTDLEILNSNGSVANAVLGQAVGSSLNVNGSGYNWNITASGGYSLSSTTIIHVYHKLGTDGSGRSGLTYATEFRLVDVKNNGVIATWSF